MTASNSASDTANCPGTLVTFTAKTSNAGPTPVYQWTLNGVNVSINSSTFSSSTLNNNDKIKVKVKNTECVQFDTAYSNIITVHVGTSLIPVSTITASDTTICSGAQVTFKAVVTQANSNTSYQWTVNNTNAGTNSSQFTTSNLNNGDIVRAIITVNGSCVAPQSATSNSILIHVNPQLTPSVSITASANPICAGAQVSYTATPVNGGVSPSFQWKVNGINRGINSSLFSPVNLANNDKITVVMTSSTGCLANATATGNIITQQVNAYLQPAVTISYTPITCPEAPITFTANIINGGSSPSYQWLINGNDIGNSINTYTSSTLTEGDVVEVLFTSSSACINSAAVKSQPLIIHYASGVLPAVSITAPTTSGICPGISTSFTATGTNGGGNPVYQWMVNNINTGATGSIFTTNTLSNKDEVKVVMRSSASCPLKPEATSNTIQIKGPAAPTITANGALTFCEGGSVQLTSAAIAGNQWYKNGSPVNGATATTYTANSSGLYTVSTSSNGCTSQISSAVTITAVDMPAVPTITLTGDQLTTAAGMTSYQWYFNNTPLIGAITNTITPANQGLYKVEVGNTTGCKATSTEYNFVLTALGTVIVNGLEITCFPNPATHELNIKLSGNPVNKPLAQLIDQTGRVIFQTRLTNQIQTINVSGLAGGVYLLNIIGKERATLKVEIIH
jgi:hypothetical protein